MSGPFATSGRDDRRVRRRGGMMTRRENRKSLGKFCTLATSSTTNRIQSHSGLNMIRSQSLKVSNMARPGRLSYGAVLLPELWHGLVA